jgi:spermidine/putrescine transport system permease protein
MFKILSRNIYILSILLFLYFPLFLLVYFSFNDAQYSSQWHQFSLKWFKALFSDQQLIDSLINSLLLAFFSSLIATFNSVIAATLLVLKQSNKLLKNFILIPSFLIILPDLILGVGFLLILNLLNIPFGFVSLLIAHVTFCTPFIIFSVISKIKLFNRNYYLAALDLGASKLYIWRKIIIPILGPTVLSAFFLGFTLSFDDVIISYFVAGPEFNILPLTIFGMIRSGATPELNALCTITLIFSLILIIFAQSKLRKS